MTDATMQPRVLVVGRRTPEIQALVAYLDEREYAVTWARDGEAAYNALETSHFDAMVAELRPQRIIGLRLLSLARQRSPEICVVLLASQSPDDIELATEAMRLGAYDFQLAPWNLRKLGAVIERGLSHQALVVKFSELHRRVEGRFGIHSIIGNTPEMVAIYNRIRETAPTVASILVLGEPGTGKELVAQAIHQASPRRDERFVTLDCTATTAELVEAELFGVEKDALAQTPHERRGRLEIADGGTLFLDEIGDLPLPVQSKLLRYLTEGSFERVGSTDPRRADVRLICASSRDLAARVDAERFRLDLYYRLNVVTLSLPPLRARRSDIPLFVEAFIRRFNQEHGKDVQGMTRGALDRLMSHDWPGNVRELKNTIEGLVALSSGHDLLDVADLPSSLRDIGTGGPAVVLPVGTPMREIERQTIEATYVHSGRDKAETARVLGIGLRTLYRKLKEYGIS
jgi:DNA-binding NtrC family response regulator